MNRFPQKAQMKRNRFRVVLLAGTFLGTLLLAPAESNAQWGPFGWFGSRNPAPVPVGPPQYLTASPNPNGALPQQYQPQQYQPYQGVPPYQANYANPAYYQSPGLPAPGLYQQPVNNAAPIQAGPMALGQPVSGIPQTQAAFLPTAGYASQWNRAPVTYYRPVTQLDPATGTTVTRMVPCTSYELQAQRTPMLTLHPTLGSNVAANRWPSIAAPAYGSTPVPSALPGTMTSSIPNYGASMIPSTGMMPAGGLYPLPGTSAQGVVPANAWTQTPYNGSNYPLTPAYSGSTTNLPSYGTAVPSYTSQTQVLPSVQSNPGMYSGMQNSGGPSGNPPSTYSEAMQNGWTPVPGLSASPSQYDAAPQVGSGTLSSPFQPGVPQRLDPPSVNPGFADPESTVKPSLDRTREGSSNDSNLTKPATDKVSSDSVKPLFQLRNVMREPMKEDRASMPIPKLPTASKPAFETPSPSNNPLNLDGPQTIPAPSDLPEPQFSPGLLDPRDRTASDQESIQRNTPKTPIQWISAPSQNEKRTRTSTASK